MSLLFVAASRGISRLRSSSGRSPPRQRRPAGRRVYDETMQRRVDALIDDSPPDWNGVHVATEK